MKTTLPPQIKDCLARYPKLYRVESESVILEYLQNRPNLVKVVVGKVESSPLIKNELNKNPSILVSSVEPWNSFVESPLEVQGGLACFISIAALDEKSFLTKLEMEKQPLILAVDHIQDPHNLGAIARSAAFFGVKYVLIPKNRQVGVTQGGVQSAQGAFAFLDIVQVTNLARSLRSLKDRRYWVLGASMEGVSMKSYKGLGGESCVIVMGAEHKGLSPLIKKTCDELIAIKGASRGVESLNVSVAAGLLLNKFFETRAE